MTLPPSAVVHNERTKLLANALDRASTACFAIGALAPTVATYGGGTPSPLLAWIMREG